MTVNLPDGKGMIVWQPSQCEGGDPVSLAQAAHDAGFGHVFLKLADGVLPYPHAAFNWRPFVETLKAQGIEVWGWGYAYGNDPKGEAAIAAKRVIDLGLAGWMIDAEIEYKAAAKKAAAKVFMSELHRRLPYTSIGLASYRYPSLHPEFPWETFRAGCDFDMPQVYWEKAHDSGDQLVRCASEFANFKRKLPLVPIGAAYKWNGWASKPADVEEFITVCEALGLPAFNFWSWQHARQIEGMWEAISGAASVTTWRVRITAWLGLRVRLGPGTSFERVTTLPRGSLAVVDRRQDNWLRLANGSGWICADWTERA